MRTVVIWSCLLSLAVVAGCGPSDGNSPATSNSKPTPPAVVEETAKPVEPQPEPPAANNDPQPPSKPAAIEHRTATATADGELSSLWTRKNGIDWPTFLGPHCDSHSPEKGIITNWEATGPKLVWQRKLGEGYGIGSISRGRLFQFDRFRDQARLTCLNAETGAELWTFDYPTRYVDSLGYNGGPRCSPVIDGDRVYIFGAEGMLHCLRIHEDRGELLWRCDTAQEFGVVQNFFGVGSTPVIEGDLLIVMVGGSPPESEGTPAMALNLVQPDDAAIVAFDKRTGEVKYRFGDDLASYASLKTATIGDRRWCFAFSRTGLIGFEPASGKPDFFYPWRARILESVNASTPVVVGNEVFISETYGPGSSLLKVEPGKHEVVWHDEGRDKAMQTHWNTCVYQDGYLYGSSGRHTNNAELRCIEWKTGAVKWSEPGLTRSSLLYVDGHLLSLSEYGVLHLLKATPEKFDVVAKVNYGDPEAALGEGDKPPAASSDDKPGRLLKYPCWSAPILSHGLLYVRGDDRLLCLELIGE